MRTKLGAKQQELQDLSPTDYAHNLERINSVRQEVNDLLNHEEVFWQQRSRAIWLPTRDKNTKFFYQRASQQRRKNHIEGLTDEDGIWQTKENKVAEMAEAYYRVLFTTSNPSHINEVFNNVERVVMNGMTLLLPYLEDEVCVALFQMHPSKAPGPDGCHHSFSKSFGTLWVLT